jgi:hypothetical protein
VSKFGTAWRVGLKLSAWVASAIGGAALLWAGWSEFTHLNPIVHRNAHNEPTVTSASTATVLTALKFAGIGLGIALAIALLLMAVGEPYGAERE